MHPLAVMNFTLIRNNLSEPGNLIYNENVFMNNS